MIVLRMNFGYAIENEQFKAFSTISYELHNIHYITG
jgi:hypothetical protein